MLGSLLMRLSVGTLALALALVGCAGGQFSLAPTQPAAPTAAAGAPSEPAGYDGPIDQLSAPVDLAYSTAKFRSAVTIGVEDGRGTADGSNSLTVHLSGTLTAQGDRVRGEIVTEKVDVDGRAAETGAPLLVQQLLLDRKGHLIELASRWPAHAEPEQPLPERYRALEQRWRDRLPVFASAAVGPGGVVYEQTGLLMPMQQMLQNRAYELRPIAPLRAVAVGEAPCGDRRCLIARHEGEAQLVAERRTIHVTAGGYAQIDIATGLILNEAATVTLDGPGGNSRLVMTLRTETRLL
jgi:hypothetical protein